MDKIEVAIYDDPFAYKSRDLMVGAARLTQRAEKITDMSDLRHLLSKSAKPETVKNMSTLPHNNIRCFGTITLLIVGASRRFLAQITRRRIGVTFCSGSLQYSDYSDKGEFVVPYEIMEKDFKRYGNAELEQGYYTRNYLKTCEQAMAEYKAMVGLGLDNDTAGYVAPQALRNILIVDATPQAWIEMIKQRICRRNTAETRYVLLRCWEQLWALDPIMFSPEVCLPDCAWGRCPEGHMCCGHPYVEAHRTRKDVYIPSKIISEDFPIIEFNNTDFMHQEEEVYE